MLRIAPESESLIEALSAGHRRTSVETDAPSTGLTGALDALASECLADAVPAGLGRDSEHADGACVSIVDLAKWSQPVDERHTADDSSSEFCHENVAAPNAGADVAQLALIELVPLVAERSVGLEHDLTGALVLVRLDGSNDHSHRHGARSAL